MLQKFSDADRALMNFTNDFPNCFKEMDYETKLHVFKYGNIGCYDFSKLLDSDKELFLQVSLSANKSYNSFFNYASKCNRENFYKYAKEILINISEEDAKCFSWNSFFNIEYHLNMEFFNNNPIIKNIYLNTYMYNNCYDKFIKSKISFANYGTPTKIRQNCSGGNIRSMSTILKMLRFINWQVSDELINDLFYVHFVLSNSTYVYKGEEITDEEKQRVINCFTDLKQIKDANNIKYILTWLQGALTEKQEQTLVRKLFYKNALKHVYDHDRFFNELIFTHEKNKALVKNWRFTQALNI